MAAGGHIDLLHACVEFYWSDVEPGWIQGAVFTHNSAIGLINPVDINVTAAFSIWSHEITNLIHVIWNFLA